MKTETKNKLIKIIREETAKALNEGKRELYLKDFRRKGADIFDKSGIGISTPVPQALDELIKYILDKLKIV